MKWHIWEKEPEDLLASYISRHHGSGEFSRDINRDPYLMQGMDEAVELVWETHKKKLPVVVYGDFDVDGVSSTTLLTRFLRGASFEVHPCIPQRKKHGYGLNRDLITSLPPGLLITVDCGITNVEEVSHARDIGFRVLITDHHEPPEVLPDASILNPKIGYPFPHLAGVGTAFKLVQALQMEGMDTSFGGLEYVALGTIADVVPLIDENRSFAYHGIQQLRKTKHPGLQVLFEEARVQQDCLTSQDIGFLLGPMINAAGRLQDAFLSFSLLMAQTRHDAEPYAHKLKELNTLRKAMTRTHLQNLKPIIQQQEDQPVLTLLVTDSFTHMDGLAGLLAGKIAEKEQKPVLVAYPTGSSIRGSMRSGPTTFHCQQAIAESGISGGGHKASGGFSLPQDQWDRLVHYLRGYTYETRANRLEIDFEIPASWITFDLYQQLEKLEPFGSWNPAPKFCTRNLKITRWNPISKGEHIQISFGPLRAIWFSIPEEKQFEVGDQVDIVYLMSLNHYQGKTTIQLQIIDICLSL